jgi:CheY-like chemotaxis protein
VLIVEDDPVICEQLAELMRDEGMVVATAGDGREALQRLADVKARVVVTDLVMPVMNGWELAEALREDPSLAALPILFLTAVGNGRGTRPPGPLFLKPIDVDSLLRAVKAYLGLLDC